MYFIKRNYEKILIALYILFTGIMNVIGYFNLPDKIATHMGINGEQSNFIPTPIYLIISFLLVIFLSILGTKKFGEKKMKFHFATAIVVVANAVVIIIQFK